uniref:Uncharacterized protein n=1 Tax=Oryza meridionalis TaxID=40149 RepID=A0A0E0FC53_9ORYZ
MTEETHRWLEGVYPSSRRRQPMRQRGRGLMLAPSWEPRHRRCLGNPEALGEPHHRCCPAVKEKPERVGEERVAGGVEASDEAGDVGCGKAGGLSPVGDIAPGAEMVASGPPVTEATV